MPLRRGESERAKGAGGPAGDVVQLILDYAKQETLGPLKGLLRFLIAGVVGAIALSAGALLILLGLLRALQTETGSTFSGNWSWAPYLVTGAAATIVLVLSAWRKRSKTCGKNSGLIPSPVSFTAISTCDPNRCMRTETRPPRGVASIALPLRTKIVTLEDP